MPTQSEAIEIYLRAKDENRPHLMKRAFSENANLEVVVNTGTISFPPFSSGLDAITKVLVHDFGKTNVNVYTLCAASPPNGNDNKFSCNWLVGMSVKESGAVRVGCGRYDWFFQPSDSGLVERLKITIEIMQVLSPAELRPVMNWLSALPYPWCASDEVIMDMPAVAELEPIADYFKRSRV
jgi:hypothetical protein